MPKRDQCERFLACGYPGQVGREPACPKWKLFAKSFNCCRFVVLDIEDGIELGDLQQVVDLLGQVEQFEFAVFAPHCGKRAHQFPDAGAVNVGDVAQVKQDFFVSFADQVADGVSQYHAALTQSDAAAHI